MSPQDIMLYPGVCHLCTRSYHIGPRSGSFVPWSELFIARSYHVAPWSHLKVQAFNSPRGPSFLSTAYKSGLDNRQAISLLAGSWPTSSSCYDEGSGG